MNIDLNHTLDRTLASSEATGWLNDVIFLIPNWKWIGAAVILFTGFVVKSLSRHFIAQFKTRYGSHHKLPPAAVYWISKDIHRPLSWLLAAGVWHLGLQALSFHETFERFFILVIHLLALINLLRLAYLGVEAIGMHLDDWVKKSNNTIDSQIAPFATKVLKIVVITFGVLLSLQSLGFNVGAVLAGLGIGSLALALAAQDTAANLFGSITIILDRPFQRGDYIKIGDTEGTVEEIGFRSTQIRTPYKSLIKIPNSTMAKEKIDNLGVRPSHRIRHVLGVNASTPLPILQNLVEILRARIKSHPCVEANEVTVFVQSIGDFDIKILIQCFVKGSDAVVELTTQQELLFEVLQICQDLKVDLPYPTQTLHLASLPNKTNG